jgi:NADH dehydrogenase [ubiquinone] 1 alpha subcomplex assembly factor 5
MFALPLRRTSPLCLPSPHSYVLQDVRNKSFETVVEIGSRGGMALRHIQHRNDMKTLIQIQPSLKMLLRDRNQEREKTQSDQQQLVIHHLCADEENLPLADKSTDLIVSNLCLHWVNDLPGTLEQIFRGLKDDGLFLASMFGENTLIELRNSFVLAEQERDGGVSPHVSPFAGVGDMGNLLSRAGFTLPAVDQETITIRYKDPYLLMHELQAMGEQNAASLRRTAINPATVHAAAAIYQEMYGEADGSVPATFQIMYLTGWTPHHSQQKPRKRGSASHSFKDLDAISQKSKVQ